MKEKFRVLHITPHMGSGVGRALANLSIQAKKYNSRYVHEIILLEEQQNKQFYNTCKENGIAVNVVTDINTIAKHMEKADIIQVEWWHHPLISKFLSIFPQIPSRLIFWCHISGNNYPLLPVSLVQRPHRFLFTSLCSYDNPAWTHDEKMRVKDMSTVINSNGNLDRFFNIKRSQHEGFNIGYVGTQNYCRLHPDFVDMCSNVNLPNSKFIMIGDDTNIHDITEKAMAKGIVDKFEFKGYVDDVEYQLSQLDIFAYPMNPQHYGTTENAIIEAMAAGIPVVLFNQCCEKYIVKHNETGFLVNNQIEYAEAIRYIYENPSEANRLGENARNDTRQKYTIENTMANFEMNYDNVMNKPLKQFSFHDILGDEPYQWLLSGLNEEKQWFQKSIELKKCNDMKGILETEIKIANSRRILREPTKFSVFHYHRYFPNDIWLSYWADILRRISSNEKY